ncbi:MAG TPA: ABC transporter ATP-binding protein [Anaerolineae bacterium]|nr:ABC transporter ATP-binding protein [Anaerolineae bacterium]HPL28187.1 ABC transporter ATP-binding protein [Anaerolineae bacterium]
MIEGAQSKGSTGEGAPALIELHDVVKTFQVGANPLVVLKHIWLRVDAGEFVSVVGPSGSGKSTLLNMITGIDRPTSGRVFVANQAVHKLSENQLARWRGRSVGVIFQFFQLLPTLTIVENVMLPMDFTSTFRGHARRARAMDLLEKMGIVDQAHKLPSTLSGGEQQRAAIARALANDPPLIVADEPTGNLDSATATGVFDLFEGLVEQGKTLFVVTHDTNLSAKARRVIQLCDGRICQDSEVRRPESRSDMEQPWA